MILDTTRSNTIQQSFLNYVQLAFQGQAPLISYYQIYDEVSNTTQKATISKITQNINQIIISFQAVLNNIKQNVILHLQAVLTNGSAVDIGIVSALLPSVSQQLTVNWDLIIDLETFTSPDLIVNFSDLYNFLIYFFTNPSKLQQTQPNLTVNYSPSSVPVYEITQPLYFLVVFDNYATDGICPVVSYTIIYQLLSFTVLNMTGTFLCTPTPNILNFFLFQLSVSA
ncbi:hypothetical protein SBFV2_gp53 [Sulfolobales Beppu filamentous virus 2]|uniref:Uncharacterized protein n=1 Tax=Sulfolobales Beppu filamentous virus 2 TaxID=2493123 RepID=A0A3Q8Q3T4_9VIRU|nr:hypothetical protein HOU84_gp53 [Sulfolobales Beppu filamentous virus 2]AZI75820.1 hypothetical protein SBFV2_gp53 [Sulfolobales Beppu filamentous virus 2]